MVTKPFRIIYAPDVARHLEAIDRKFISLIQNTIEDQLQYEPDAKTTNRKPLQFASQYGEWELRFGPNNRFRVIYKTSASERTVWIGAVGEKRGNKIYMGGEEVRL
jgi:hypothetical protein